MDLKLNERCEDNPEKAGASRLLIVIFYLIIIVYAFIAIKVILFKTVPLSALFHSRIMSLRSINVIPFHTINEFFISANIDMGRALANIGGNIAIFVPFGIFVAYAVNRKPLRIPFLWLLITSFMLEIIQYVFALGSSDIDDILLNFTGGAIGIGIYKWFRKKTSSHNHFLMAVIGFLLISGLFGGTALRIADPNLLSFTASKISYINENDEVIAGWNEAEADLFGDLTASGMNEITVYMNPKYTQMTGKKETDNEYVHIQINNSTQVFIRYISTDKNTVISNYEKVTHSDIATLLETRGITPTVRVWLSNDNMPVAEAVLIGITD
ncbi:VanZ family protein [Paenibacillus glacialis]|uniref:VanZ-like domain-containing protein n=1 Tax=Paenibacillus glacialis TaxID=494026 RepID=A0A168LK52_9BACL|nr:VanZ family protein [Paenibacillus glacialis]OAB43499.1 hypothetical protein PGLA_08795 [Paenibacillus glacialis]